MIFTYPTLRFSNMSLSLVVISPVNVALYTTTIVWLFDKALSQMLRFALVHNNHKSVSEFEYKLSHMASTKSNLLNSDLKCNNK